MKALCFFMVGLLINLCALCQALQNKLSLNAAQFLKTAKGNEEIKVLLSVTDTAVLRNWKEVRIFRVYNNTVLLSTSASSLSSLLNDNRIAFVSLWRQPKEELTTGAYDLSLNKINLVHSRFPSFNGSGVLVSIKEQRFDSTDIDFKGRYVNAGTAAATESIHASIMATIVSGAGNSSPFAKGVAWGSNITSSDFATLLPDASSIYLTKNIRIQNHSYGTSVENFYGPDAAAYDASVYDLPTLVHVFSAGNSGNLSSSSGTYSGIANFANLTGSFKMAKNVITVGHVDSANNVLSLSSRGPAYDGRIKPELVAFGEDGSSGAAALVSGTVAVLQQAFRQTHGNAYPSASLLKAVLLNSADDIGAKGPDYISGYGSLNALNAVQTITGNNYFEDAVANNGIKTFSLNVPANASQIKITVVWTDTAASVNATKALVNDLDALLTFPPASQTWKPWILNGKANKDSLLVPAVRGVDTLNNVEQIAVEAPQAGTYQLQIKGGKIVTPLQPFSVAYQIDTANSFVWTYPSSSDVIKAGVRNYLRWQTTITGSGVIEYSTNGTNWQTLSSLPDVRQNYFVWTVPDTITTALLRMRLSSPALTFVSDTFVVSPNSQVFTGFNCADSFLLYWNKASSNQYQVYQLGAEYLQPLLSTTDSFHIFQKQLYPSLYYAVAPRIGSKLGQRSFTINYTSQGVGCYVAGFFSVLQNGNAAVLSLNLGTLYNVTQISFQKLVGTGFQTIQSFLPTALSQNFTDNALSQGMNRYRAMIKLSNGVVLYSDEDLVYYLPNQPVIFYPNPSSQSGTINVLVKDQGLYAVNVFDAAGRLVKALALNNVVNAVSSFTLPKGIYFVQVRTDTSRLFTQKLIVY